ncbi:MAG: DUF4430 domain-containing protein [bacterium]
MSDKKFTRLHGWLAAVMVVAAIITGSFVRMSNSVGDNINNDLLIKRPAVLGAAAIEGPAAHLVVALEERPFIDNDYALEDDDTIYSFLDRVIQEREGLTFQTKQYDFGKLITNVADFENGNEGYYWLYSVNGEDANVSIDNYILEGGELIELRYAPS